MELKTRFTGTAIGSMPFTDPDYAVKVSLERLPDAPIWPQLPRLGIREQMEVQYSEGIPCAVIDEVKKRMYVERPRTTRSSSPASTRPTWRRWIPTPGRGDCSALAITPSSPRAYPALEKALKAGRKLPFVKVQTTGPLQLRPHDRRREQAGHLLQRGIPRRDRQGARDEMPLAGRKFKALRQERHLLHRRADPLRLRELDLRLVKREDVVALLQEMIAAVHAEGGIGGDPLLRQHRVVHPRGRRRRHRQLRRLRVRRDHLDVRKP